MICEKCGKHTATTHIKTVINGNVTEKYLCSECAASEGLSGNAHSPFDNNGFASLLASVFGDTVIDSRKTDIRCPACNSTFSDIAKSGKAGCSECYKTFRNEFMPYIKRIHGSTVHCGKIPNKAPLTVKPQEDTVEALRMKLSELVREEKYEEAAKIRDKIKMIEGESNK